MTPLTARIYLEAYYDLSDQQYAKNLLPLLDEFNGWDTIPVAALQDTWPDGEWEKPESDGIGGDEVVAPGLKKLIVSNPDTSKSLRDGAMVTVIQALLDGSDEDSGLISEAELLTDFLPKLKSKLYEHASSLKPSSHQQDLLYKALEYDTDVDLSPFKGFSAEDLSFLVSRLRNHSRMTTLCISNRPDLTGEDLRVVLRDAAGLKALYILEDPQVSAQGMGTFLNDCDLYHSDLLRQPIKPQPERSFTDIDSRSSDDVMPADQVCRENDVSQLVWIGITDEQALDESHRLKSGAFDWQTLRQEKGRNSYGWSGPDLRYKRYPLDIPLPTFKTVAGLLRLLKWGSFSELFNVEDFSGGAAFSFAMASSIPGGKESGLGSVYGGNGFGIGPLGTTLYLDCTPDRIPPNDAHEHLDPGRWAIVLIHEAIGALSQKYLDKHQRGKYAGDSDSEDGSSPKQPKREEQSLGGMKNQDQPFRAIKRLRYALVTPSTASNASDHDFIVADIPTFLEHTMGKSQGKGNGGESQKMVEAWNSQIATIDTVDFYGDDDIHEILPKVFPGQKSFSSGS